MSPGLPRQPGGGRGPDAAASCLALITESVAAGEETEGFIDGEERESRKGLPGGVVSGETEDGLAVRRAGNVCGLGASSEAKADGATAGEGLDSDSLLLTIQAPAATETKKPAKSRRERRLFMEPSPERFQETLVLAAIGGIRVAFFSCQVPPSPSVGSTQE